MTFQVEGVHSTVMMVMMHCWTLYSESMTEFALCDFEHLTVLTSILEDRFGLDVCAISEYVDWSVCGFYLIIFLHHFFSTMNNLEQRLSFYSISIQHNPTRLSQHTFQNREPSDYSSSLTYSTCCPGKIKPTTKCNLQKECPDSQIHSYN